MCINNYVYIYIYIYIRDSKVDLIAPGPPRRRRGLHFRFARHRESRGSGLRRLPSGAPQGRVARAPYCVICIYIYIYTYIYIYICIYKYMYCYL